MEQKKNIPDDRPERRDLASWKEIAQYLAVNVRTAQKWEQDRHLPVRRVAGSRGRVSADTASLDVWKRETVHMPNREDRSYHWPLGPNTSVELRFIGPDLAPTHIDLLREYLDLFKSALP